MALVPCGRCGGPVAAEALACPQCGRSARERYPSSSRSGVLIERADTLSIVLRRVMIAILSLIVAGTWFAAATYARSHRRQETADEKAIQCDLIEAQGEDYYGELAECRNRVAYLRAIERR